MSPSRLTGKLKAALMGRGLFVHNAFHQQGLLFPREHSSAKLQSIINDLQAMKPPDTVSSSTSAADIE